MGAFPRMTLKPESSKSWWSEVETFESSTAPDNSEIAEQIADVEPDGPPKEFTISSTWSMDAKDLQAEWAKELAENMQETVDDMMIANLLKVGHDAFSDIANNTEEDSKDEG